MDASNLKVQNNFQFAAIFRQPFPQVRNILWSYWKLKLIWNAAIDVLLEEGKEREVKPGSFCIKALQK